MTNKGSKYLARELAVEKKKNAILFSRISQLEKANREFYFDLNKYLTLPFFKAVRLLISERKK